VHRHEECRQWGIKHNAIAVSHVERIPERWEGKFIGNSSCLVSVNLLTECAAQFTADNTHLYIQYTHQSYLYLMRNTINVTIHEIANGYHQYVATTT